MTQPGFFDFEERLASLSGAGDLLENLSQTLDIGLFRKTPDKALRYPDRHQGGGPPFDPVPMVSILSLQTLYDLCDDKTEFMLRDRLNFMRFPDPGLKSRVLFRRKPGKDLRYRQKRANAGRSGIRNKVRHVFARQKHRTGRFVHRIGIERARFGIGRANIVCDRQRLLCLSRAKPAQGERGKKGKTAHLQLEIR